MWAPFIKPRLIDSPVGGVPVSLYTNDRIPIHPAAIRQALGMAALPGVVQAIGMPDLHAGSLVPNGFVLATEGTIIPGAVGRDINCGMRLMRTNLDGTEVNVAQLLEVVAERIHLGKRWGPIRLEEPDVERILAGGVGAIPSLSTEARAKHPVWDLLTEERVTTEKLRIEDGGSLPADPGAVARGHRQIGRTQLATLGSGNHFLEFQVVDRILNEGLAAALGIEKGGILMMVHSGSRGLGHSVGTQYMQIAKSVARGGATPVKDTYALEAESPEGQRYLAAMNAAANYAFVNRFLLAAVAAQALLEFYPSSEVQTIYDVAHNIVKKEEHGGRTLFVHRKGATRAFSPSRMAGTPFAETGQPVLIPGSMGTASYILVGHEGSEGSLQSVNHGAGRVLSRSDALNAPEQRRRKNQRGGPEEMENRERLTPTISDKEFRRAMRGIDLVYADGRTIKAEAPQAYKDIDDVMEVVLGAGLATGVARLRPIGVIKE